MFELKSMSPERYRAETRRSSLLLAVIFAAIAMFCAGLAVMLFGEPAGDNFKLNLAGVLLGLVLTFVLVKYYLSSQAWLSSAVYGWQLKRNLMSVTNIMHKVRAQVDEQNPLAMRVLRFYHLGLTQMYLLDGNTTGLTQMTREVDSHREAMEALGLDIEQERLDSQWLEQLKSA